MKNPIYAVAIATLLSASFLSGCQSSATKVENAEDKVQDAAEDMQEAQMELNEEIKDSIQLFKTQSMNQIIAHEKSIAEFKVRIQTQKLENRAKYEKKLNELDKQNSDLKKSLDDYKAESIADWATFKVKFNQDINAVGNALKNLTD